MSKKKNNGPRFITKAAEKIFQFFLQEFILKQVFHFMSENISYCQLKKMMFLRKLRIKVLFLAFKGLKKHP